MIESGPHDGLSLSRRGFAAAGTAALASLAGCTALLDRIGDAVLEDVNLLNGTEERLVGALTVTDPAGEVVLDESFDLPGQNDGENQDGGTDGNETDGGDQVQGLYADVWTDAGEYEISVELEEGYEIAGVSSATETVSITDPEEEMLVVLFGAEDSEPISFDVVTSLSEIGEVEE